MRESIAYSIRDCYLYLFTLPKDVKGIAGEMQQVLTGANRGISYEREQPKTFVWLRTRMAGRAKISIKRNQPTSGFAIDHHSTDHAERLLGGISSLEQLANGPEEV
jgi:hypothetical protein